MISFSPEEEVSRQFLVRDDIDCTVIVIDSSVLERNPFVYPTGSFGNEKSGAVPQS